MRICFIRISAGDFQKQQKEDGMRYSFGLHRISGALCGLALAAVLWGPAAQAEKIPSIKMMTFQTLNSLAPQLAQEKGFFAKHGIEVEILIAPNSSAQRDGLVKGELNVIHTSADNSVSLVEERQVDSIVVMAGDDAFNSIIAQKDVESVADLRGRTVIVDSPHTAFALLLYRALREAGLKKGDYEVKSVGGTPARAKALLEDKSNAAGLLSPPYTFRAQDAGLKELARVPTYHSAAIVVMRDWASANGDTLVRYLRGVIEGRRWLLDPANKEEAVRFLGERLKLSDDMANRSYALIADPNTGFDPDATFDMQGFRNVLGLRAETFEPWKGQAPEPDKFIDLSYYEKALAGL